jgi:glycosyltransferase involved in cell wall biosynthesis
MTTRVAFTVFGGDGWTGGINYLRNLLSAMADTPGRPVEAVLFIAPETPAESVAPLLPFLSQPPVVVAGWGGGLSRRLKRLLGSAILQRDLVSLGAFRAERIDVVFQHAAWYGLWFPIPTLAWIADFQHRRLPHMFSSANRWKRNVGYAALSYCASQIMVSSQDAKRDCERYFPHSRGRIAVLPFCVTPPDPTQALAPDDVRQLHGLPKRFFYMPNQLWRHKNHLLVIEALKLLQQRGIKVVVVSTGKAADARNPGYPTSVLNEVRKHGLEDSIRFLGMVPYDHVMPLARASLALINPSLFEGWSTTVEEAKALGVPLLLSDIPLHREQALQGASFFDPHSAESAADGIAAAWANLPDPSHHQACEMDALAAYSSARLEFAHHYASLVAVLKKRR